ncbi:MAG: hypothetical protein QOF48_4030 [Verrucomicrobiota bacterium]|jgi:RNA recognition motif-containing protein
MSDLRLFVGNLSFQTTDAELREFLTAAGGVATVNLSMDRFSGRSRGFAFVDMNSADEAQIAVELFNGKTFQGRALTVNIARPREDRPPRSKATGNRAEGEKDLTGAS